MSGSYRGIVAAVGGIALLIAFSIGVYATALAYGHYQHERAVAGQHSADDYAKHKHQADMDRAGLPSLAEQIISNPEPDEGTQREKRDLAAQEATATWAFWVVMLSGGQFILSAFGLFALLKTIQQGKESIDKATEANDLSMRFYISDRRPKVVLGRVSVDSVKVSATHVHVEFTIVYENKGATEAADVKLFSDKKITGNGYQLDKGLEEFVEDRRNVRIGQNLYTIWPADRKIVKGWFVEALEDIPEAGGYYAALHYMVRYTFAAHDDREYFTAFYLPILCAAPRSQLASLGGEVAKAFRIGDPAYEIRT
ncbi:MAG TPA: hypothetical protein VLG14_01045 [Sphingomonas sp.]|nr:hypothetical protein [Sphingomonas sp.]